MTIPQWVIKAAIKGGWIDPRKVLENKGIYSTEGIWQQVICDPDFWMCLGKELGWRENEWHPTRTYPDGSQKTWAGYMPHAHHLYDLILFRAPDEEIATYWEALKPQV